MRYFHSIFFDEAEKFVAGLGTKAAKKVLYIVDLAEQTNDPKLFKKLREDIWEFRIRCGGLQIRLLAFWDRTGKDETLVIAALGFIKKRSRVPENEIKRALLIRIRYFENK
jgi:hypothetical protein